MPNIGKNGLVMQLGQSQRTGERLLVRLRVLAQNAQRLHSHLHRQLRVSDGPPVPDADEHGSERGGAKAIIPPAAPPAAAAGP
jgi:hypothetical protein